MFLIYCCTKRNGRWGFCNPSWVLYLNHWRHQHNILASVLNTPTPQLPNSSFSSERSAHSAEYSQMFMVGDDSYSQYIHKCSKTRKNHCCIHSSCSFWQLEPLKGWITSHFVAPLNTWSTFNSKAHSDLNAKVMP